MSVRATIEDTVAKAQPKTNTTVNPSDEELLAAGAPARGKGRPTPSRREREAANRRPIVGATPADRKAARARLTDDRERARVGLANGEERYLPAKDRGEQRRYVRDYVDARWSVGEVMLPLMAVFLIVSLAVTAIEGIAFVLIWLFVALFLLDAVVTFLALRRRITAKWGSGSLQRGTFLYVVTRQFQMRFLRLPKPQVKRGQYPV
ncbi:MULTISPECIES: DUF3043 domain-containing protein [unclassified Curtobacterium]|uniref:DUF3043 domain-containing protein n=1 Tax=unclassified Curtobacterium TaxID=257496 RepID=UPI0021ABCC9F|nr:MULTISPECIES: DUF3043 domain-containing protein [unclassified Curtobacterium]WIB64790.1 DUF3043 domain-containing protein [Curtobacterium sp. MCBD17_040]WIB68634.1 DUF3043 domain-containing protein [Curtobacterium sp. MCBD17_035]